MCVLVIVYLDMYLYENMCSFVDLSVCMPLYVGMSLCEGGVYIGFYVFECLYGHICLYLSIHLSTFNCLSSYLPT